MERFNPSEEDIVLYKNTHAAQVHPVNIEITEQQEEGLVEKVKSSVRKVTNREPLPEEIQLVDENTQYNLSRGEKKQLSRFLYRYKGVFQLEGEPLRRT